MANTIEYSLLRDQRLIDVVDDDWEAEELPTDEVILPEGVSALPEELDDDFQQGADSSEVYAWGELGLLDIR
eukprot:jgi/Picsp_1/3703/NSC_06539-R1_hypothetical protein CHLNCDRAFT_136648 [Chlorella variabilis]